MADAFFSEAVVLLCDYNEEGALGIVINRVTEIQSPLVLDQMGVTDRGGIEGPVLWGGPVQPGAVFLTFSREPNAAAPMDNEDETTPIFRVAKDLLVSPSRDIIAAVSGDPGNPGAFLSLGYSGWAPGQLDNEIQRGSWIFMEIDRQLLFETPPEERYEACLLSLGVESGMIWMHPVNE